MRIATKVVYNIDESYLDIELVEGNENIEDVRDISIDRSGVSISFMNGVVVFESMDNKELLISSEDGEVLIQ